MRGFHNYNWEQLSRVGLAPARLLSSFALEPMATTSMDRVMHAPGQPCKQTGALARSLPCEDRRNESTGRNLQELISVR